MKKITASALMIGFLFGTVCSAAVPAASSMSNTCPPKHVKKVHAKAVKTPAAKAETAKKAK